MQHNVEQHYPPPDDGDELRVLAQFSDGTPFERSPAMGDWDIQPGETPKGFHAFTHYRDLPTHARSIDAAYAEHQRGCEGKEFTGKRRAKNWHKWSTTHGWVSRATAHDADLSRRRREKRAADLEVAQDRAAILARAGLSRIALRFQTLDIGEIPVAVLDRWVKTLTDVEMRSLGHQDKIALEHSGEITTPVVIREQSAEEAAELAALRRLVAEYQADRERPPGRDNAPA